MSIDYDNYIVQHKACVIRAFKWIIQNISTKKLDHIFPNLPSIEDVMIQLNNHDASKYSPKEYNAYDNYFYGEKTDDVKKDFDYAWLNHMHMNPHHWQYWILKDDDSIATDTYITVKYLEIPDNYILEMICDWWSFSWKNYIRSHNKNDLYEVFNWYDNHRDKIAMHYRSREKVEHILNIIRDILDNNVVSHSDFDIKKQANTIRVFGKRIIRDPLKASEVDNSLFGIKTLSHHGIKGQQWGVRNGPPYPLRQPNTDISDEPQDYFKDSKYYHDNTAFNAVSDHGFIIAEKIPKEQNVDRTNGVEIGIGVTEKGRGVGTGLIKDLVDWFDGQDEYDVMWWPVDESNKGSIRIAEKNGFIKDPLGDNYIYATGQAYRDLGINDTTPDHIYNNLDTFDYGCIINGKRYNETNLDQVDWSKYRTSPVKDFEKTKIGTCWDYTNYQHAKLKDAGINHDTHMLVMDTKDGPVTHTFTTYEDPVNHKQYWLEQALYSERGIHPINSYTDAVDVISRKYDPSGKRAFDVYEFNPDGMDQGLSDQEFFNKATFNDPVLQRK